MQWKHVVAGMAMAGIVLGLTLNGLAADTKSAPPKVTRSRLVTLTGTVQAIDVDKRLVTIKGSKGNEITVHVTDAAKNLPQVKVGDQVSVKYYEELALRVVPPGQAAPAPTTTGAVATAKPGEMPGAVAGRETTATVTIEAIDKKAGTATFKGPEGTSHTVKAVDPKNLDLIKVGDQVEITYTEALAVSVQKPAPKHAKPSVKPAP